MPDGAERLDGLAPRAHHQPVRDDRPGHDEHAVAHVALGDSQHRAQLLVLRIGAAGFLLRRAALMVPSLR